MNPFRIKQGSYHRRLVIDLSGITTEGASKVVFRMRRARGDVSELLIDREGEIVDDSTTQIALTFDPDAEELDTPGDYNLEAVLTFDDGDEAVPTAGFWPVQIWSDLTTAPPEP